MLRRSTVPALRALLAGLVGAGALVAASATPVAADADRALALTGFYDLVVDEAHGHVLISQGSDTVVVTDLAGAPVQKLTGLHGAEDMVLSDDGATVYVALYDGDAIAAIDTATLAVQTFPTGDATCPDAVTSTLGLVWIAYSCSRQWHSMAVLDPATGEVTLVSSPQRYNPVFDTSPARPGVIVVGEQGISPQSIYVYTVTGGEAPTVTQTASRWDMGSAHQFAITPDGAKVITSGGGIFTLPTLAAAGKVSSSATVAIRQDGMVALGTYPGLSLLQPGATTPWRRYTFPESSGHVSGLAWGATRVYAITKRDPWDPGGYRLRVITPRPGSAITVTTDRARYGYDGKATVTVRLSGAPAGSTVSLYRNVRGGSRQLVTERKVDGSGRLTARVAVRQTTTFTATYAGSADVDGSTGSRTVTAAARVSAQMRKYHGRSGRYHLYRHTKTLWVYAQVSPNHAGDCLRFGLQVQVKGRWRDGGTTGCARLSPRSVGATYMKGSADLVGYPLRFRARWAGDSDNLAATSAWQYAKFVR